MSTASELYSNHSETDISVNEKTKGVILELGDIVEITAAKNTDLHQQNFFITYIDNSRIDLTNIVTFLPSTLNLDSDGKLTDESVQQIMVRSKSEEQGYARQHLLLPKTWIDIHFGGEVPTIITGEITNLEKDMIEITTFPDLDVIYIDFEYKGLPDSIPIDKIDTRVKPAALAKIATLLDVRDKLEEGEVFDPDMFGESEASLEYSDVGEALISLPDDAQPDPSIRDDLHKLYLEGSELADGEALGEFRQAVELTEKQMRHGVDTQVNDMLDVLLSDIPTERRTKYATDNIHLLIERFRELRNQFSKFDANGNVSTMKTLGVLHKPLAQHIERLDTKLKWILPVVALKRKVYSLDTLPAVEDALQLDSGEILGKDANLQDDYIHNRLRGGDKSAYLKYYESINSSQTPYTEPSINEQYLKSDQPVSTAIEAIVNNLEDFYSTALSAGANKDAYIRRQYLIQRYNIGESRLAPGISPEGKRVYMREEMTPNEKMTMKSVVVLPKSAMIFSKVDLPGSSILTKSGLSQNYLYLFRLLTKRVDITPRLIDNFDDNMDKSFWEEAMTDGAFEKTVQEFLLTEKLEQTPERLSKFLQSMIPDTATIIRLLTVLSPTTKLPSLLSLQRATDALEPFMVYNDDLNYTQYNAIRYFVKTQSKEYMLKMSAHSDEMRKLRDAQYVGSTPLPPRMELILSENRNLLDVAAELYKIHLDNKKDVKWTSSAEWLSKIYATDNAQMFYDMLRLSMISLVTPQNLSDALKPENTRADESEDLSRNEKIKATDCARRVLVKKYLSMNDLQKDNTNNEIYCDKEFDDTPYEILKSYKDESKNYTKEDFIEFLAESLVQKHDCPPKMANEMAINMIEGKKRIQEGEYAILEVRPHLPTSIDESVLSEKERRDTVSEAEMRKKIAYYKRVGDQWIHEEGVDETAFINSNELFCNMSKICFRDTKNNICESVQDAEKRMRGISRKQLVEEFDERFAVSFVTLEVELNELVKNSVHQMKNITRFDHVQRYKANNIAFEMGRFAKDVNVIRSPHLEQRSRIQGQTDFIKKQHDIIEFVDNYCRDAMGTELDANPDNQYWLYCVDTNSKLFPTSLYQLAKAFVSTDSYVQKQHELSRKQGVLSDDGDSIVDKHSGEVLRKIDFVDEEGFDEHGFKIVTSEIMEQDVGKTVASMIESRRRNKDRVFEDDDSEMVYKLFRSISTHVGVPMENIEEFVLRTSVEIIKSDIKNEAQYKTENDLLENDQQKRLPPYIIYRNKRIILIVTSIILVAIQTAIPSFKIQKTFPGCVQSFTGYPDEQGAIGDTRGIQYLACILYTIKRKSSPPWDSMKPLPMEVIKSQLEQTIRGAIITKNDIIELYVKKREYLILHPEEVIPAEHSMSKWIHFMPPTVDFHVLKSLRGIPSDYKNELVEMQKTGNKLQRNQLAMYTTKAALFGLAIIENINGVVKNKGLLLKTASNVFFTENACCNEKQTATTLQYFENENKEITVHVKMVRDWGKIIDITKRRARAPFLYDPKRTGISYSMELPQEHFEKNVYIAFIHYCNLNTNAPIPESIRGLFPEKLPEYNPNSSLSDKIEFLKRHGKRFTNGNLMQLMDIVNARNIVDANTEKLKGSRVSGLLEFLGYLDTKYTSTTSSGNDLCDDDDIAMCSKFRELLSGVLNRYNPRAMVTEDNDETYRLNNWLTHANSNLLERIVTFISVNSKMSPVKRTALEEQLSSIHMWNMDPTYVDGLSTKDESAMYSVTQFMRESVFAMSRVYPEMILNNHEPSNKSKTHWNFAAPHNKDINNFIDDSNTPLVQFKNDKTLSQFLEVVQFKLNDMSRFLVLLPAFTPIHRGAEGELPARSYYSLFTKRTLYMIYSYVWYSVLYEYVKSTDDDDLIQIDIINRKQERRDIISENSDPSAVIASTDEYVNEDTSEFANGLSEMHIISGDKKKLKARVTDLLLTFIDIDKNNKKGFDHGYADIEKRITRSRIQEKKLITDFLRDMDPDELYVENTKKILKLGRWNIGLRKGLVDYDKERYVEERNELFNQLSNRDDVEDENDIPIQMGVAEIQEQEDAEVEEYYDQEANDIRDFRGTDADGGYYAEDNEDAFGDE